MTPQPTSDWAAEFDELTKSMDGQYRPQLRLLIRQLLASQDEYWKQQEMGKSSDCAAHEAATAQRVKEEIIRLMEKVIKENT
jgi:hypothetical protein